MSKEVQKHTCQHCDSSYKLLFDLNTTSGFPRFCPFCSGETYDDDLISDEEEAD
jgi:hypothetical protein